MTLTCIFPSNSFLSFVSRADFLKGKLTVVPLTPNVHALRKALGS